MGNSGALHPEAQARPILSGQLHAPFASRVCLNSDIQHESTEGPRRCIILVNPGTCHRFEVQELPLVDSLGRFSEHWGTSRFCKAASERGAVLAAVLSGNRNFEGRVHLAVPQQKPDSLDGRIRCLFFLLVHFYGFAACRPFSLPALPLPTCLCPSACRIINTAGAELIATGFLVSNPTVWSLSCFTQRVPGPCSYPLFQPTVPESHCLRLYNQAGTNNRVPFGVTSSACKNGNLQTHLESRCGRAENTCGTGRQEAVEDYVRICSSVTHLDHRWIPKTKRLAVSLLISTHDLNGIVQIGSADRLMLAMTLTIGAVLAACCDRDLSVSRGALTRVGNEGTMKLVGMQPK